MSNRFKAYTYDVSLDRWRWEEFTRDGLLDQITRRVFRLAYGLKGIGRGADVAEFTYRGMLNRAGHFGPDKLEVEAIRSEWQDWWNSNGDSVLMAREYAG